MNLNQRPDPGTTVHLRPTTKTCGQACREYREARVVSYAQWPYVLVEVLRRKGETSDFEISVHSDNIGLHPAKDRPRGDMAGGDPGSLPIPKPLFAKPKPLDLPEGWEEQPLF